MLDPGFHDDPARFQTMSIASVGGATIQNKNRVVPGRPMNVTQDIPGAQPMRRTRGSDGSARPDLFNTRDISGALPKALHREKKKPMFVNRNDDIPGSMPHPYTFKTTRHVNPMEPVYTLPQDPIRPFTPPKIMRPSNVVEDIEGTKPSKYYKYNQRDTMRVDDIEGASAGWKPRHKRKGEARDILNVGDITKKGFRSTRVTDALNPTHVINGMRIEDEPGMHPKGAPSDKNAPFYSLTTHDIEGARAGWKPKHELGGISEERRRHFRNINYISDIEGTAAGSKAIGMRTKRCTDPNNPVYSTLDGAVHEVPHTPPVDQRRLVDPRDEKLSTLTNEVQVLRKELEIAKLQQQISQLKGSRPASQASRTSSWRPSSGAGAGAGAGHGPSTADRMVLRSANGEPRAPLTPSGGGGGGGGVNGNGASRPPTHGRQRSDIAPVSNGGRGASRGSQRSRHSAALAAAVGPTGSAGGSFRDGGASIASFGSVASVASARSAYSNRSRASARSRARAAAARQRAARGPTPTQRREAAAAVADLSAVMALPDRPPSALSRAGSASFA